MLHSDVHVDRPLSNFAVEYSNPKLIGSLVAPFVPVNNKSDSYFKFTKKDKFTIPEDLRGPKDKANQVTWSTSTGTYGCKDRALRDFLSDGIVANSDSPIKPRERTAGVLTNLLLLAFERRVASLVFTAGNYSTGYKVTLSGTDQWSDYDDSDPVGNIDTGKAACFIEPNTLILGKQVWDKLKRHPAILDHIKGGATTAMPAVAKAAQVAEIFEIENILIGTAKYNSANAGATESYSYVWGKYAALAYIDPAVSLENMSAWKTFRWNQPTTDAGYKVRAYRDEELGGGGEFIEVETSLDEESICTDVCYLISGAVA